jgi:hypothetical protein
VKLAVAAVEVGGAYALSKKVPSEAEGVRARILVALFSLSWRGQEPDPGVQDKVHGTEQGEEERNLAEDTVDAQAKRKLGGQLANGERKPDAERLSVAARALVRALMKEVMMSIRGEQRKHIQRALVGVVRRQVAEGGPAAAVRAAQRGPEIMELLAQGGMECGEVLDGQVAPMGSWPKWSRATLPEEGSAVGGGDETSGQSGGECAAGVCSLCRGLLQRVGPQEVLLGGAEGGGGGLEPGVAGDGAARDSGAGGGGAPPTLLDGLAKACSDDDVSKDGGVSGARCAGCWGRWVSFTGSRFTKLGPHLSRSSWPPAFALRSRPPCAPPEPTAPLAAPPAAGNPQRFRRTLSGTGPGRLLRYSAAPDGFSPLASREATFMR